ncbi:MAG: hypothetical protein ACREJD_07885 [Phycisphaerales bacterium]
MNTKAFLLAAATLAGSASAADLTWTGAAGDHDWNNKNNWNLNFVPTSADDVYIFSNGPVAVYSGHAAVAKSLYSAEGFEIYGSFQCTKTFVPDGGCIMVGSLSIDRIDIKNTFDVYGGVINPLTENSVINLTYTGTMNVHGGADATINTRFFVGGDLQIHSATLRVLGSAAIPVSMSVSGLGVCSLIGESRLRGNDYSYLANDAVIFMRGLDASPTIAAEMKFYNGAHAWVVVEGGTHALIGNPTQIAYPAGKIDSGYWSVRDNSTLSFPDGRQVTSIEGTGVVILDGPQSQIQNLHSLKHVTSKLSLDNKAFLPITPAGGVFTHEGTIELSAGSRVSIEGGLICTTSSVISTRLSGLSTEQAGTIYARDFAHLDGFLLAEFNAPFNRSPNQPVALIQTGTSGDGVDSEFVAVTLNTLSGQSNFSYLPYSATLNFSCAADLNSDGLVDDADFVWFAQQYDTLACNSVFMPHACTADLTGDGFVEDADFVLFAAAYNTLLCD